MSKMRALGIGFGRRAREVGRGILAASHTLAAAGSAHTETLETIIDPMGLDK
jgi:hypothetical protein